MPNLEEYFNEELESVLLEPTDTSNHEAKISYDVDLERINDRDVDWSGIYLTIGSKWGDHSEISFDSLEDLDTFVEKLVEFRSKAEELRLLGESKLPKDWSPA